MTNMGAWVQIRKHLHNSFDMKSSGWGWAIGRTIGSLWINLEGKNPNHPPMLKYLSSGFCSAASAMKFGKGLYEMKDLK